MANYKIVPGAFFLYGVRAWVPVEGCVGVVRRRLIINPVLVLAVRDRCIAILHGATHITTCASIEPLEGTV